MIKLIKDESQTYLEISKNLHIYVWNEWSQIIQKKHWYTFTVVHVEGEIDNITNTYEFIFGMLGIGFTVRHYRPGEDVAEKLAKREEDK